MVRVTKDPRIRLFDQVVPLVVVSRRKVPFMAIAGHLWNRAMVSNHYGLTVKILGQFRDQELTTGDVPSNEVGWPKLSVTLSDSDSLEVTHPLSTLPHRSFVVTRRGKVCPRSRH
ncbi:hypothetical protein D3C80_1499780 [compost metagenome]